MAFVEMRGIGKRFGATVALRDASLEIERGEVHALVGENGSGKSTLMNVLAGVYRPDAGTMWIDGEAHKPSGAGAAKRRGISLIHQELALCPHLSVAENILLGTEPASSGILDRAEMRQRASAALSDLGHPDLDVDAPVEKLPIGVRQIVEIARAVAVGAEVIILDEPTSSLAGPDVARLFQVVRNLRDSGKAIVYISHFLDEIEQVADVITVLRDGQIVRTGPAEGLSQSEIVSQMVGRGIDSLYPRSDRRAGQLMLEIEGLSGASKPVDTSLQLHAGEVVGIAGLNGSGRTELLRCIFGLDPVRSGAVRMGSWSGTLTPSQAWGRSVGMVSEDRKLEGLALEMSIADNLMLTRIPAVTSDRVQGREAVKWIERAAVKCEGPWQSVRDLSGGNQQKVAIARLLCHGVDVLLLDEPTRGIDVASKEQMYRLIDQLAASGKAILMVSSYLPELLGVCDRIAVMRRGVLGVARPVAAWDQEALMREATVV